MTNKNKRPCECGHLKMDHHSVEFSDGTKSSPLFCMKCGTDLWCYNYRPMKNLKYLEWLNK